MGGRLRFILCGGAPLSPETHTLIKICLCENVQQGYGLTESSSCGCGMGSMYNFALQYLTLF